MIPVTKPYLPNRKSLDKYIDGIYQRNWLTNNGPLVQELTQRLEEYLGVENLLLVSNGTLALQVAYQALGLTRSDEGTTVEAITTPFTFVATASSLKWEGIEPVFVDIDPESWCLNPYNIQSAITPRTRVITPVHVFGNACEVEQIQSVAEKNGLKVVYDAAHAFGVNYKGESLLKWGDASTLSFHATKVFHTVEGGAIVFKHKADLHKARALINFGIIESDKISEVGANAKMSEFQAAMGLANLDEMSNNMKLREGVWEEYHRRLQGSCVMQRRRTNISNNYAYFPVLFRDEQRLKCAIETLRENGIVIRRYFHPSLNTVDAISSIVHPMPFSEKISQRIACLPLYTSLSGKDQEKIIRLVAELIK